MSKNLHNPVKLRGGDPGPRATTFHFPFPVLEKNYIIKILHKKKKYALKESDSILERHYVIQSREGRGDRGVVSKRRKKSCKKPAKNARDR